MLRFFFVLIVMTASLVAQKGDLDRIAKKYCTDKSSNAHNYTEQYEYYFERIRNRPLKFLEIGFCSGGSAYTWEEYFPNAQLHYIDIADGCYAYARRLSNRSHLYMVDQSNEQALIDFVDRIGGDFDIIIDDGSHFVQHQIISFKTLFPYVKSGGVYIIEDLFSSYWIKYGGGGTLENPSASPQSAIRFLQNLLDDVNYIGARNAYANIDVCPKEIVESLSYYQRHIKAMHFYCNLCFIFKR